MNEKKNRTKNILILVLVIGLVTMTTIYALVSTNLRIESGVDMKATNWDIHFDNLSEPVLEGHATVVNEPILNRETIMNLKVNLTRPGDSVTYTFDIVNEGDIDALLRYYTLTQNDEFVCVSIDPDTANQVCDSLTYTLKYTDTGYNISQMDTLDKGQTKNVTLKIEYPDVDFVPGYDVSVTGINARFTYIQN